MAKKFWFCLYYDDSGLPWLVTLETRSAYIGGFETIDPDHLGSYETEIFNNFPRWPFPNEWMRKVRLEGRDDRKLTGPAKYRRYFPIARRENKLYTGEEPLLLEPGNGILWERKSRAGERITPGDLPDRTITTV